MSLNYIILTAALALPGLNGAAAAEVHTGNSDQMPQWYGRAGGLVGSDVVSHAEVWQQGGHTVQVSFSEAVAEWTNMPRAEAQVGPVTDSFGGAKQRAGSMSAALPEIYGRAGDDQLLEQMQVVQ